MKLYTFETYVDWDDHPYHWEPSSVKDGLIWTDRANAEAHLDQEISRLAAKEFENQTIAWERHKVDFAEYQKAKTVIEEAGISAAVLTTRHTFSKVKSEPVLSEIEAEFRADPKIRIYEFETLD